MKLDTKAFRYLSAEDWRVLTAVEIGTKNHNVVPTPLIASLAALRGGSNSANRSISVLAKVGLIAKVKNAKYDGYRLTYGGLDYLALHAHTKGGSIIHLGSQMGTGKESDIYLVTSPGDEVETGDGAREATLDDGKSVRSVAVGTSGSKPVQSILKLHRLGRISFRSLTRNRDYHGGRQHASWQYLSRLSAQKEFTAMKALYDAGFPVPRPIAWNRHTVVMSLIPGMPLRQVGIEAFGELETEKPGESTNHASEDAEDRRSERDQRIADLYDACMELALRLAEYGCIHGDFNEFNILIENVPELLDEENDESLRQDDTKETRPNSQQGPPPLIPHLIDFPQITSLSHPQARHYFDRDINCIKSFFNKKYNFVSLEPDPTLEDALARLEVGEKRRAAQQDGHLMDNRSGNRRMDVQIAAMGFSKKMARDLEVYFEDSANVKEGEAIASQDQVDREWAEEVDEGESEIPGQDQTGLSGDVKSPPTEHEPFEDDGAGGNHDDDSGATGRSEHDVVSLRTQETPDPPINITTNGGNRLTKTNLETLNDGQPLVEGFLNSKMAAVSLNNLSQRTKSKPKAAAGWAI